MEASIIRLARVTAIIASEGELPKQSARSTVAGVDIAMPLADILDFDAEKERLNKEIKAAEAEIMKLSRKLENEGFLAKAPEAVVEENRRRLAEDETRRNGLQAALKRLSEES